MPPLENKAIHLALQSPLDREALYQVLKTWRDEKREERQREDEDLDRRLSAAKS